MCANDFNPIKTRDFSREARIDPSVNPIISDFENSKINLSDELHRFNPNFGVKLTHFYSKSTKKWLIPNPHCDS